MANKFIDKLAWIQIVDKQVLLTLSAGKDTYYIPGGKRENGENDFQALIREIKEELSVDLILDSMKFLGVFEAQAHGKSEGITVRMTCYSSEYTGFLKPASEIQEMVWFTYKDKDKSSPVDKIIFEWLFEQGLIKA